MKRTLRPEEQAAIEWLARHRSGLMSNAEQQNFEHWLAANEQHQHAWLALQQRLNRAFSGLAEQPAGLAQKTLLSANNSRRQLLRGALTVAGLGVTGFWLTRSGMPLDGLVADLSTAVGERKRFALEDGSSVLLNAESRVDLAFSHQERRLLLRRGALEVDAKTNDLPLVVETTWGRVQTLEARFSVTQNTLASTIWVQQAQVQLYSRLGNSALLKAGEGAQLNHQGYQRLELQRQNEFAWQEGWLELHDRPLSVLIDALRPYHSGPLRLSPSAADLRISGLFSLDNIPQVLASLQEILPLRVHSYFGWWTTIEPS